MSKRILIALSALFAAGCFFGGEEDSPLPIVEDPKTDSLPKARLIVPGLYVGDYSWIDSTLTSFESEFLLDTNGAYRLFWIYENEAFNDQRGAWIQKDSSFQFSKTEVSRANGGVFDFYSEVEDDTNSVRNVTDSSFIRREWTPLRQKPYWISYHRITYPKVREGVYTRFETFTSTIDSIVDTVVYDLNIELKSGKYLLTVDKDSLPYYQAEAKYYQLGSFLVLYDNRDRQADSTLTYSEWFPFDGAIVQRMQTVSDTAFAMWSPSQSTFELGKWDRYSKKSSAD